MNLVARLKLDGSVRMSQLFLNIEDKTLKTAQMVEDMKGIGFAETEFEIVEMTDEELKTAMSQ